jgi:hypothetical protein
MSRISPNPKGTESSWSIFFRFQMRSASIEPSLSKRKSKKYFHKRIAPYPNGTNDEWVILGHQLLEFLFMDHIISNGYPNPSTKIKNMS